MSDLSIIKPLRPRNIATTHPIVGWDGPFDPHPTLKAMGYPCELWLNQRAMPMFGISVISAVEVAKDADGIERGPEYHISMALQGADGPHRMPADLAAVILKQFGALDGWEEDNHVDHGVARNFWRPVAEPGKLQMIVIRIPVYIESVEAPPLPSIHLTGWRARLIRRIAALLYILFEP